MKNKGWTKLYREQFSHWISKKPWCDGYAWAYLYTQANHKPGMINFRNEYIKVDRGQFLTSKKKLGKIFGWTRRHVDNFLKALNVDHMITYRMTYRYTVITIVNYEIYQGGDVKSSTQNDIQNDNQMDSRRTAEGQQVSTNKNVKNGNNDKNVKNEDTKSEGFSIENPVVYQLTLYLEGKIRENNKSIKKRDERQLQSWCKDMDKLIRIDKAKPDEVKQVIDWVVEDDFWGANILSAKKLRMHYPRFYKKVIDRGKSLDEQIKNDHRFDDIEDDENLLD